MNVEASIVIDCLGTTLKLLFEVSTGQCLNELGPNIEIILD